MTNHDLTQAGVRRAFEARGDGPWTVVYDSIYADGINGGPIAPSLTAASGKRRSAWTVGWHTRAHGGPGFMQSYGAGRKVTTYLPRGEVNEGVELLVFVREFHGAVHTILELDQQFRLFHNLRYIPASNTVSTS